MPHGAMLDEGAGRRAWVVDADLMGASAVAAALRRLGYEATISAPSVGLPERLAGERPALVLVNLAMPGDAGPGLIRAVRSLAGGAELVILGYAGHVERAALAAGRQAGADGVAANSAVRGSLGEVLRHLTPGVCRSVDGGSAEG